MGARAWGVAAAASAALLAGAIGVASDSLSSTAQRLRALQAQAGGYPAAPEPDPPDEEGQGRPLPDEAMGPEIPGPVPDAQGEGRLAPPGDEVLGGEGAEGREAVEGGEAVDPGSAVTGTEAGESTAPTTPEPRADTEPTMPPPGPTPPPEPGAEAYRREEMAPGAEGVEEEEPPPDGEGVEQEEAAPGGEAAEREEPAPGAEVGALGESLAGGEGGALRESLAGGEGGALRESLAGGEGGALEESLAGAEAWAGEGAEGAVPPGATEEELRARIAELEAGLADREAEEEERAAEDDRRISELESDFDDLWQRGAFLEENRASRIERLQAGIDGMRYVFEGLSAGSSDLDGDLAMLADELQGVARDAARYAGPREAALAARSEAAVQAAREAIARGDLYAARIDLGRALADARAARAAAADGSQHLFR